MSILMSIIFKYRGKLMFFDLVLFYNHVWAQCNFKIQLFDIFLQIQILGACQTFSSPNVTS